MEALIFFGCVALLVVLVFAVVSTPALLWEGAKWLMRGRSQRPVRYEPLFEHPEAEVAYRAEHLVAELDYEAARLRERLRGFGGGGR